MSRQPNGGFIGKENVTDNTRASGIYTLSDVSQKIALNEFPPSRYTPSRSLRFRNSVGAYLSKTNATAGNRQKMTFSFWVKRGRVESGFTGAALYGCGASDGDEWVWSFSDYLYLRWEMTDGSQGNMHSKAVFRDPSSWYHIMLAIDTTQPIASNRLIYYVNGKQVTSFTEVQYPAQNTNTKINGTLTENIGRFVRTGDTFNGYMTELNFIDGQQLTPASFGEADPRTGEWKPKRYTGTYGTTGYYLPFDDNSSLNNIGLDKALLSTELITNGSFPTNVSGWTVNPGTSGSPSITWVSGTARIANSQNNGVIYYQAIPTTIGNTYYVRGYVSNISIGGSSRLCKIQWSNNVSSGFNDIGSVAQSAGSGWISGTFVATATTTYIHLNVDVLGTGTQGADWDMISVAEVGYKNHWNLNNFSLTLYSNYDSMTDVPGVGTPVTNDVGNVVRGNYNVWNPLTNTRSGGIISHGNLKTDGTINTRPLMLGTQYFNSGKWYCEVWCGAFGSSGDNKQVGITTIRSQTEIGSSVLQTYGSGIMRAFSNSSNNTLDYRDGFGNLVSQNTGENWWVDGFWIGFAVDIDNDTMSVYKNGSLSATVTNCNLQNKEWTYFWEPESSSSRTPATNWYWNFGQQPFVYTPPAGHKGLCTTNLPDPIIKNPKQHFDISLYAGNSNSITVGNIARQRDNYEISRSLRFNRADTPFLSRTAVTPTDGKKATFSFWIKKNDISTDTNESYRTVFYCGTPNVDGLRIGFARYGGYDNHEFHIGQDNGSSSAYFSLRSTAFFKKTSSWYHFVVRYDSTDTSEINRVRIYVDGVEIRSFVSRTNAPLNHIPKWQVSGTTLKLGKGRDDVNEHIDMYLAEVNFVDGQALTPESFGQFDVDGSWQAKRYTGTYGANGYYLPLNPDSDVSIISPISDFNADFVVVAGGGGGGNAYGAPSPGGGAGGYRTSAGTSGGNEPAESAVGIKTGTAYKIIVGAGGTGGSGASGFASKGSNSLFANIFSVGGGFAYSSGITDYWDGIGGSGSGGNTTAGGYGTLGQGKNGGTSHTGSGGLNSGNGYNQGGGGGASAAGGNANGSVAGAGGNGLATTISGSSVIYAGGGAGGNDSARVNGPASGGTGGGGSSVYNAAGNNGTANTGGGGAGGSNRGGAGGSGYAGGNGGSGIIIIKIPDTRTATFSAGVTSSLSTAVSGYKVYTVTATSTTSETVTFS